MRWYLAEKHPQAGLLPSTPEGRASVLRWAFYQTAHVSPPATAVHRSLNPAHVRHFSQHTYAAGAEQGRKELARVLPVLEDALGRGEWLAGAYSLADIAFAPHLGFLVPYGFDLPCTPRVRAWLERLRARPAWHRAHALIFDGYAP